MAFFKNKFPIFITFFFGILGWSLYYIPNDAAKDLTSALVRWDRIIAAFGIFIGIYSLLRMHAMKMSRKSPGWAYSAFLFAGFILMAVAGLYNDGAWFWTTRHSDGAMSWIYNNIQAPAGSTMFSVLAFFIASAAYRTFRVKTFSASLLLVSALIVMLGRVPIGALIYHKLPIFSDWLMAVPNLAVKRGIIIGVCLGAIGTSLKIIFGIEKTYLGKGGK